MSDPKTSSLREDLEIRVISLLTGEISEADAEELEKILTVDEELSAFRDRMATLMGDVHAARDEIVPPAPEQEMKLSEERRRAIFENVEPVESKPQKDEKKWWHLGLLEIAAMLLLGAFLAAVMIPAVGTVREKAQVAGERFDARTVDMAEAPTPEFLAPLGEMEPTEVLRFGLHAPQDKESAKALDGEMFALRTSIPSEVIEGTPQSIRLPVPVQTTPVLPASAPPAPANFAMKAQKPQSQLSASDEVPMLGDMPVAGRLFDNSSSDFYDAKGGAAVMAESKDNKQSEDLGVITGVGGGVGSGSGAVGQTYAFKRAETAELEARWGASEAEGYANYSAETSVDDMVATSGSRSSTTSTSYFAYVEAKDENGRADSIELQPLARAANEIPEEIVEEEEPVMLGFAGLVDNGSSAGPVDPFAAPSAGQAARRSRVNVPAPAVDAFASAPVSGVDRLEAINKPADGYDSNFGRDRSQLAKKSKAGKKVDYRSHYDMDFDIDADEGADRQYGIQTEMAWAVSEVWDSSSRVVADIAPTTSDKLDRIVIPQVNFSGMPMSQVVETLSELSVEYDPEKRGVHLDYIQNESGDDPRVNISLRNLNLDRILQFVTQQVNYSYDVSGGKVSVQPQVQLSNAELAAIARNELVSQAPKPEKQTAQAPVSTFSLNVSDVSFELAQAALASQRIPSAELIRTEEFVNSFTYSDPAPREDEPVSLNWEIAQHPYQHNRQIVRFSLQTQAAGRNAGQPLNLNLLVDNSGSMQRPDRRAILEKSLEALQSKLTDRDQLNVVLFARQPKLIANAANVTEQKQAIVDTLNYKPEGGTNLESGLEVAYNVAQQNYDPAASNRVILMTDGAANLGEVNSGNLAKTVIDNRKQGIALDAYGIGWEDYNDALLEEITRNGDGRYAFLNDVASASEDFAEKLAGTLRVSAADVKVQILWNPDRVKTYRQIGYDLHQLKEQDFRDNTVDAAEIGEAESGTALYVVQIDEDPDIVGGLGTLQVRYRVPATGKYVERAWQLEMPHNVPGLKDAEPSLRLAASSALFAERLANNPFASNYSFEDLEDLTRDLPEAFPTQPRVVELQNMIQSANSLFTHIE